MVGVTGIEPATSWSQTTRAPICATPREHLVSLENTLSLNDKDYSTISYLIRQHFFSTFFIFFHFFYFNSSINASTGWFSATLSYPMLLWNLIPLPLETLPGFIIIISPSCFIIGICVWPYNTISASTSLPL